MTTPLKTVIVTGVSQGLGLAIARRVAADPSYRLVGLSRKLTPAYEALIAEYGEDKVEFHPFDVSKLDAIPPFIRQTVDRHGPIWGVVNNAGIGKDGVLATQHLTDIQYMIDVNLTSAIVFAKYASRSMLSARAGRIISISCWGVRSRNRVNTVSHGSSARTGTSSVSARSTRR